MTDTVIDDPMLDEEWLAAPAKRSRLRVTLAVVLAAALCFLGGAMLQKTFGASTAEETAAPGGLSGGQLPEGLSGGLPEGGLPGGGIPGGDPGESDGTGDGATNGDEADALIGEVVEVRGNVWIVEDLGGERHEVKVGDDTDIVRETTLDPADVTVGDPVDLSGTTEDGQLQATEVTLR